MSKKLHIVAFLLYLHSLNQKRELALKAEGLQFQKSLFFLNKSLNFLRRNVMIQLVKTVIVLISSR